MARDMGVIDMTVEWCFQSKMRIEEDTRHALEIRKGSLLARLGDASSSTIQASLMTEIDQWAYHLHDLQIERAECHGGLARELELNEPMRHAQFHLATLVQNANANQAEHQSLRAQLREVDRLMEASQQRSQKLLNDHTTYFQTLPRAYALFAKLQDASHHLSERQQHNVIYGSSLMLQGRATIVDMPWQQKQLCSFDQVQQLYREFIGLRQTLVTLAAQIQASFCS